MPARKEESICSVTREIDHKSIGEKYLLLRRILRLRRVSCGLAFLYHLTMNGEFLLAFLLAAGAGICDRQIVVCRWIHRLEFDCVFKRCNRFEKFLHRYERTPQPQKSVSEPRIEFADTGETLDGFIPLLCLPRQLA